MLGNELKPGDLIFRSKYNSLEQVLEVRAVEDYQGRVYYKMKTQGFAKLDNSPVYKTKTWYKNDVDVLKVFMTPEMKAAVALTDNDYSVLTPRFMLTFKDDPDGEL